jgi:hypothetical protein
LQREYLLLKKQAAIDWKAMYADKHTSVTVQSIVEDYGDLEKSISLLIETGRNVNASESNREQSGIIRRQFCGIKRQRQFFEVPYSQRGGSQAGRSGGRTRRCSIQKMKGSRAMHTPHLGVASSMAFADAD